MGRAGSRRGARTARRRVISRAPASTSPSGSPFRSGPRLCSARRKSSTGDRGRSGRALPAAGVAADDARQPVSDRIRAYTEEAGHPLRILLVVPDHSDRRNAPEDAEPSFLGDSVARWDKDTLVVDVTHFTAGGWLGNGFVHSDALHLVVRYTRVDRDQLNYEVLIEDPKVLTKPFTQSNTLMLREGACASTPASRTLSIRKLYEKLLVDPSTFLRRPK